MFLAKYVSPQVEAELVDMVGMVVEMLEGMLIIGRTNLVRRQC